MNGEEELQKLEQEWVRFNSQGGWFSNERERKLKRAREIEKSGTIYGSEKNDPILEAAYQRALSHKASGTSPETGIKQLRDRRDDIRWKMANSKEYEAGHNLGVARRINNEQSVEGQAQQNREAIRNINKEQSVEGQRQHNLDVIHRQASKSTVQEQNLNVLRRETGPQKTPLRRPVRAVPQQQSEKKERIKSWMAACMIIVALCVDGIQLLLAMLDGGVFTGPVISAVAYFAFWVWFLILGVSFTKSPKKLGAMGGAAILEFFLSFLPGFTAGIAATSFMTMAEDKGGLLGKAASMAQGKMKA